MRLHILGVCGTFMSGVAILAKQSGHDVTGSDANVYPPMSTQLRQQEIKLLEGYDPAHIDPTVDCVIVGNVIKRGNPAMEYVLAQGIPYLSGPQWLAENVLKHRWVLGVAGTHGKTTTSSLLAWILAEAGLAPGFLIGGVPENFGVSAQLGEQPYFVIEADEYDSAFFDKRSKFVHYHPKTLILNNLEYDHADIFPHLEAIKQQFHYLIRTVPGNGLIVRHAQEKHLEEVLKMGCWTPETTFGSQGEWQAQLLKSDGSAFTVLHQQQLVGEVHWDLLGQHNVDNALAAIAAAHHVNVPVAVAIQALSTFKNVKRRLEVKGKVNEIVVYDDFAHHPTAIATTLAGLRAKIGDKTRMIAVLEFGSYTMRTGVHKEQMQAALSDADMVVCKSTEADWGLKALLAQFKQPTILYDDIDVLVKNLVPLLHAGDHVVVMSNSGFGGIHQKLLEAIKKVTTS
ncbi:MAG: UDP-N-acetylmuramate:L-alanyl-gamma-D-glutamyl-meso-diaminopimelate ligase [Gammaproteobacteria bacterium]|nr:MAG: UDP-N-acetylmuramate:L-alanyl-gamma-D-glutamyl-meso-diaminopimelate ligase [Gammaproteobacteria bacterium]